MKRATRGEEEGGEGEQEGMDKLSESLAEDTATRGRDAQVEETTAAFLYFLATAIIERARERYLGAGDKNKNAMPRG